MRSSILAGAALPVLAVASSYTSITSTSTCTITRTVASVLATSTSTSTTPPPYTPPPTNTTSVGTLSSYPSSNLTVYSISPSTSSAAPVPVAPTTAPASAPASTPASGASSLQQGSLAVAFLGGAMAMLAAL